MDLVDLERALTTRLNNIPFNIALGSTHYGHVCVQRSLCRRHHRKQGQDDHQLCKTEGRYVNGHGWAPGLDDSAVTTVASVEKTESCHPSYSCGQTDIAI
jgi:hypothetical protein